MRIPRVACINDLSGFGRCSLTTAISVISAAGVQACPVPTAVLSKHTGFPSYYFADLTNNMPPYLDNWHDLEFDAIYSGFLGSSEQIEIVEDFIFRQKEKKDNVKIIVDPVMGDHGRLYATYTDEMNRLMKRLVTHADIITPNITEACFLTENKYNGEDISDNDAQALLEQLHSLGCRQAVLTGIVRGDNMINMTLDENGFNIDTLPRASQVLSGTGDLFASVLCAEILKGKNLPQSVNAAGNFISKAIEYTINAETPLSEGVVFEPLLYTLGENQ